ncbi:MAG: hypothetical protein KIT17_16740 [Rubrivivax sp.]|nr:hypothetical protein [Rubrivivax sp.]
MPALASLGALLLWPSWGGAQTARPPGTAASGIVRSTAAAASAAGSTAAARGAASSAAMQRAQRAAESPLRAILEAGKVRRRVEPDPGRPTPTASAAVPAEPQSAVPDGGTAPAAPAPDSHGGNGTNGANGGNGGPGGAPAEEDSPILVIRTLPLDAVPPAAVRVVPEPAPAAPSRAAISPPVVLPALPPLGPPAIVVPVRLVHMVEPELPPRLLDQMVRPEVVVEMTIGTDGRVGDVEVMPPVPRQVVPIVRSAVQQWRYAPLPAPRRHRVQIVFRGG